MEDAPIALASGRSCGTCTLCCKVIHIEALKKPQGVWCLHCKPGKGCSIYDKRPDECGAFHCGYLLNGDIGEEWKPERSKIVLVQQVEGKRIVAYTDPQRPNAWRREPYYSTLKKWARMAAPQGRQVVASVRRRVFMI